MNFNNSSARIIRRIERRSENGSASLGARILVVVSLLLAFVTGVAASIGAHLHPNLARGAGNSASLAVSEWDSVNLFNGNLNLAIPLGISYPLRRNFEYQFALSYNSNVWDLTQVTATVMRAEPNRYANAGLGWDLSFGRLIDPFASDNGDSNKWTYISPDGAYHPFYATLHPDIAEPEDNVYYTRDGTYYRLQQLNGTTAIVESPDGKVMTFEFASGEWRLIRIADQFKTNGVATNSLSISYATDNIWTITDNHGRTQTVYFKSDSTGSFPRLVDRVESAAFGGGKATYTFAYTVATVSRPLVDNDTATAVTADVPLLASVTGPDGSKNNFSYHLAGAGADSSGRLASRQLPTLGRIEWTYQSYSFTSAGCATPFNTLFRRNTGVATRRMTDAAGNANGSWTYASALNPATTKDGSGKDVCLEDREISNTETTPLGDKTIYYFSVNTQGTGPSWNKADYALPFTKGAADASGSRYLSRRKFDCDGAGANCQLLRSIYVRYEQDGTLDPASREVGNTNRREASQRVVYHDDVDNGLERFADVNRSNFDGLGHYRQLDTGGNFGSGDVRQTFTNYDATTSSYPSVGYSTPGTGGSWVLSTFSKFWTVEDASSSVVEYSFDHATGFLNRVRHWKTTNPNGGRQSDDVVIVSTPDAAGQVVQHRYYGGDVQPLGTGSLDSLSLGADQYQLRYTYQYGVQNSARFYDASGQPFGPKTVDEDRERNTGLVLTSRDSAGLATVFSYDVSGRLRWVKPSSGHGAWTEYRYSKATGSDWGGQKEEVFEYSNGSTTSPLTYNATTYESFGRQWGQQRRMPDGNLVYRNETHNALGWMTATTEFTVGAPKWTEYLNYDPFQRVRTIRPPDGPQHDTTYLYAGIRTVTRTPQVAVSYNKTTGQITEEGRPADTIYDRQGRVWQLIQHYKDSFGSWRVHTTVNSYNVSGRLLQSTMDGQRVGELNTYDGRGFLSSVASDNETTSYLQIDALGKSRLKSRYDNATQIPVGLANVYDRAGRLTAVRDANSAAKVWKEFIYADTNGANDWRAGKLWKAKRYNDMSRFLSQVGVATVTETYTYGGVSGRVSLCETEMSDQLGRFEKFAQTYRYTELGQVQEIGYPNSVAGSSVVVGRDRKVIYGYAQGRPTSVGGSLNSQSGNWINSIGYHPNGIISQVTNSNGVTQNIAIDSNGITRVAAVSTTGARNKITNAPDNLTSTNFQYDGEGKLVRAGDEYFVRETGYQPPSPVPPSQYISPCESGYKDSLGLVFAATDSQCSSKIFYYYTAHGRLYKLEDGVREAKTWYFSYPSGLPLTEYSTEHAHYQPWPSLWRYTRDYVYADGKLIATEELRRDSPTETEYYHHGYGSAGMLTDRSGIRIEN